MIHDITILILMGVLLQIIENIIVSEESERNNS
jgi:hypothetical protein